MFDWWMDLVPLLCGIPEYDIVELKRCVNHLKQGSCYAYISDEQVQDRIHRMENKIQELSKQINL